MQTQDTTPLITDQLLAELASPNGTALVGQWGPQMRALLAVAIPEMAVELLQRRQAGTCHAPHPAIADRIAATAQLNAARLTIRAPDPIARDTLITACTTLLELSTFAEERAAATDILAQLQAVA